MKALPYAVIDLGTNTFHMLIAEQDTATQPGIRELFRDRQFVKLAEDGIETIGEAPYQRGLSAIRGFRKVLDEHQIPPAQVRAFGTAAMRTASNGAAFIQEVKSETGIDIHLITGAREALLIQKGVSLLIPPKETPHLIMDIGGGSVEFILANADQVIWYESFPIGVAVLHKQFYAPDPISATQLESLKCHIRQTLQPLSEQLSGSKIEKLIGASGTFDVLEKLFASEILKEGAASFQVAAFHPFYEKMLPTTIAERRAYPGMPENRADMMLVALVLIHEVLKMASFSEIMVSSYAMKEGMLYELLFEQPSSSGNCL